MKTTGLHLLALLAGWFLTMTIPLHAQPGASADDLLKQARRVAFTDHQYSVAIRICSAALELSPGDPDIRVFLGRLYAWSHEADSARLAFSTTLRQHPAYEDACIAWSDLEFWNNNDSAALAICLTGLAAHPESPELRQRQARLIADLHRSSATNNVFGNRLGVSYDFIHFDRQYADPWHLASIEYSRQTGWGSCIGWVNYANRFRQSGVQFEAEAYPHISRTLYGYVDLGYSPQSTIFPAWRTGASLFANLPHAFEADAGFRLLHFSASTMLYTFSLGKYYRSFWFNARSYLVPGQGGSSQSITLTTRYYYGGADDYYSLAGGAGLSPDDNSAIVQLANPHRLQTEKLQAGWRHTLHKRHIVFTGLQWLYQEYQPGTHDHQWDVSVGYLYRF
ncbi:MAG: YaiO family outer membrane beta-barrel protein [Bacteroidetes bacterium]|nr:YaiO family outer membrane beta-barrel protein [Bacteroidota bacterium]